MVYEEMIHEAEENNKQMLSVQKEAGRPGTLKSYEDGSCGMETQEAEVSRAVCVLTFPVDDNLPG